jgi:hypothetical protein
MKTLLLGLITVTALFTAVVPASTHALTVAPVKLEIEVDPGQTIGGTFELYNEEAINRTLFVSYENFEPSGDLGTPRFVGAEGGLATWLSATSELVITPDERIVVPYTITVPADTQPGGYFAAIFYGSQNPELSGGEVAIGGKLGILILLRVRGDITEEGGINRFNTNNEGRIYTQIPLTFITQMTNRGADRIVPQGAISITNIFGSETKRLEVNSTQGSILPNSSRTFTELWAAGGTASSTGFFATVQSQWEDFHVGLYTATVELVWGADQNVSSATYWFILFPWQLLICISIGLAGLIICFKFYNRFIIARSKKSR